MPANTFKNLTVQNPVVQNSAATADNHLVRLGEARALFLASFKGPWSSATTYGAGVMVSSGGAIWLSLQAANLNQTPAESAWWTKVLSGGSDGASAYVYVGYASASDGTGFSLTPADGLGYMAVKVSSTVIASPAATDFAGLWRLTTGPAGGAGTDGTDGNDGASVYGYVAYASDTSGTGFSLTPGAGLYCMAVKLSATVIASPAAGDFTGLWINLRGAAGSNGTDGADGAAGASVYGYVGYASDASGTGFSLTPGDGLNYLALKLSSTVIVAPAASDFTGLWRRYAIDDGVVVPADTDGLAEGATNLYFTTARVLATALTGLDGVPGGDVVATDTLIQAVSKLQNRLKTVEGVLVSPGEALFAEGTIAVGNNVQSGTQTGLDLAFTPARVQLTVQIPSGGLFLIAALVGAPTADGFAWTLNALTDSTNYKIHYRITA